MQQAFRILVAIFLCLVLVVFLLRRFRTRHAPTLPADVPHSLRRGTHTADTRRAVLGRQVQHELNITYRGPPSRAQIDQGVDIMQEGGGFHARHMWADWFYRRATLAVLRTPTPDLVEAVRGFFQAAGAATLVTHLDNMVLRLRAAAPGANWYQALGRANVAILRRQLDNVQGLLFSGHRSGNFEAGTRQDITYEAVVQLGDQQVRGINRAAVTLLEHFHLQPYVDQLNDQLALNFTHSVENLTGPSHMGRTQEARVDPTMGLHWRQRVHVWLRAPLRVQLLAAMRWHPRGMIMLLVVIIAVLWFRLLSSSPIAGDL